MAIHRSSRWTWRTVLSGHWPADEYSRARYVARNRHCKWTLVRVQERFLSYAENSNFIGFGAGAWEGSLRPLPACPVPTYVGKGDSVVRIWHKSAKDPCHLVWPVNQILRLSTATVDGLAFKMAHVKILFTCRTSRQGSSRIHFADLTTESRSPATRGGRGRCKPCRAPNRRSRLANFHFATEPRMMDLRQSSKTTMLLLRTCNFVSGVEMIGKNL